MTLCCITVPTKGLGMLSWLSTFSPLSPFTSLTRRFLRSLSYVPKPSSVGQSTPLFLFRNAAYTNGPLGWLVLRDSRGLWRNLYLRHSMETSPGPLGVQWAVFWDPFQVGEWGNTVSFRNRWHPGVACSAGLHLGTSNELSSWGGSQALHSLPPQQDGCGSQQWLCGDGIRTAPFEIFLKRSPSRALQTILHREEHPGREYLIQTSSSLDIMLCEFSHQPLIQKFDVRNF